TLDSPLSTFRRNFLEELAILSSLGVVSLEAEQSSSFLPGSYYYFSDTSTLNVSVIVLPATDKCFSCCSSSNDNESINPYITDGDELFDYALNHIAHRADAFNPFSSRYNPSTQNGYGGHTARWSHSRARSNNEIVRNFYNV
ncbi:12228_t:CDS:2, partial [Funneliformis geosporum]